MREIKFRAWDIKTKKFNYLNLRDSIASDDAYSLGGSQGTDWAVDRENSCTMSCKCELQQFTGLKDKDGKEIYEGDIIKNFAIRDLVIFEKGIFTTIMSHNDQFNVKQPLAVHCEIEIIGNIYENPELIE